MTGNVTWKVAAGVAVALLAGILVLASRGGRYAERQAGPESPEAQRALEVVRALAGDPERADAYVADGTNTPARPAGAAAAVRLSKATGMECQAASWYGGYLRVSVSARMPGDRHIEEHFFFVRSGDRLRITGVDQ
jgi:hypothetical protein